MTERSVNSAPTGAGAGPVAARRKLVKGAFSVPAALVVGSASAQAATSLGCVARQVANPQGSTTFVAVTIYKYTIKTWKYDAAGANPTVVGTESYNVVRGSDVAPIMSTSAGSVLVSTNMFILSGQGYTGTTTAYTLTPGAMGDMPATPALGLVPALVPSNGVANGTVTQTELTATSAFASVAFDATGKIVGFYEGATYASSGAAAVGASCWTSFKLTHP